MYLPLGNGKLPGSFMTCYIAMNAWVLLSKGALSYYSSKVTIHMGILNYLYLTARDDNESKVA